MRTQQLMASPTLTPALSQRERVNGRIGNKPFSSFLWPISWITALTGWITLLVLLTAAWPAMAEQGAHLIFRDVLEESALAPYLRGIQSHQASWGDVTGNGYPDLFIGPWGDTDLQDHREYQAPGPPVPGRLFYNNGDGTFTHDPRSGIEVLTTVTSGPFVDLNNNGHLDLYLSNQRREERNLLFRNDGTGLFTEIGADSGVCPEGYTSRSVGVMDFDGDGLLDLLVLEGDRPPARTRLYRNLGNFNFEDVTEQAGLPLDIAGIGVAVGDLTGNGWPDFMLTQAASRGDRRHDLAWGELGEAGSRIFLNEQGQFREADYLVPMFVWPRETLDDKPCGVVFGDLNNNGRLDIVVGHHDSRPWRTPKAIRVYLNEGMRNDRLVLRDITEEAGLKPLGTKAPHVEIRDFDNSGWSDVYVSLIRRRNGRREPLIYRHAGVSEGVPRFVAPALSDLDFPRAEHAHMNVHQIAREAPLRYYAFGPAADYNRNGCLDVVFASWWPRLESILLRNDTEAGNYLTIRVEGRHRLNRMGIGAKVYLYEPDRLGDAQAMIGFQEISTGYGYSSAQETIAHFGLAQRRRVDMIVQLPHGGPRIERRAVAANQMLTIQEHAPE